MCAWDMVRVASVRLDWEQVKLLPINSYPLTVQSSRSGPPEAPPQLQLSTYTEQKLLQSLPAGCMEQPSSLQSLRASNAKKCSLPRQLFWVVPPLL